MPFRLLIVALIALLTIPLVACGEDENGPDPEIDELVLLVRPDNEAVAAAHHDHWHGSLPSLEVDGDHLSLGAQFNDANGDEIDIDYDVYELRARIAVEGDTYIEINNHGNHFHLVPGDEPGTTAIFVALYRNDGLIYETVSLPVNVVDDADNANQAPDMPDVHDLTLLDRADGETPFASTDGDSWNGELMPLEADGPHHSFGAIWLDGDGDEFDIDYGHFVFHARFADGAPELLDIDSHGNHVHLIPGSDMGTTTLVFQLMFHGIAHFESPPIDIEILVAE